MEIDYKRFSSSFPISCRNTNWYTGKAEIFVVPTIQARHDFCYGQYLIKMLRNFF